MKKYLLKAAAGMIVLAMFFLTGCDTDNSVNFNEPVVRVVGTVHGVVTDGFSNDRIEDVTVKVVQKDKMYTTETDSLGYYIVDKLYSGTYEVTFHIDGYAVSRAYGYIPTEEEIYQSKEDIYYNETVDEEIYSLTAGFSGRIFKAIDDGNVVPAEGVTVYADFSHFDLHPDKYTATTDANGEYSFSQLPSTPEAQMFTLPFSDGTYSFENTGMVVNLIPGQSVKIEDVAVQIVNDPVHTLTHNVQDGFEIDDDIVISFNKPIDTTSFEVYLGIDKTEINDVVWSDNNTTVTISPDEPLRIGTLYEMYYNGKSADGNYFDDYYNFKTQDGIEILRTSFQPYDGYNEISSTTEAMKIYFSHSVNTSHPDRYFTIDGIDVSASWSDNGTTLELSIPSDFPINYESGDDFRLRIGVYSTLADYDGVEDNWRIYVK